MYPFTTTLYHTVKAVSEAHMTECSQVSKRSPTKYCINNRTQGMHESCCLPSASLFSLYMEMKRSFMLFPLVALFIAVWRFINWFHLRFRRVLFGKAFEMWFWLQTILFPLSHLLYSRLLLCDKKKKKKSQDFQSGLSYPLKPNAFNSVLRKGDVVLVLWLTWKEEQRISFVISLISIISAVWMNFKWLAWSYLC